jgi:hypothetical protein
MKEITVDNVPLSLLKGLADMFPDGAGNDGSGRIGFLPHITKLYDQLCQQITKPSTQYLAFECEGRYWIIQEGENADKWRKLGFDLTPVKPSKCERCAGHGEVEFWVTDKADPSAEPESGGMMACPDCRPHSYHRGGLVEEVKSTGIETWIDGNFNGEVEIDSRFRVHYIKGVTGPRVVLPDDLVIFKRSDLPLYRLGWTAGDSKAVIPKAITNALKSAKQFIENGTELGFINMPAGPDPAHHTLPAVIAALGEISKINGQNDE